MLVTMRQSELDSWCRLMSSFFVWIQLTLQHLSYSHKFILSRFHSFMSQTWDKVNLLLSKTQSGDDSTSYQICFISYQISNLLCLIPVVKFTLSHASCHFHFVSYWLSYLLCLILVVIFTLSHTSCHIHSVLY